MKIIDLWGVLNKGGWEENYIRKETEWKNCVLPAQPCCCIGQRSGNRLQQLVSAYAQERKNAVIASWPAGSGKHPGAPNKGAGKGGCKVAKRSQAIPKRGTSLDMPNP